MSDELEILIRWEIGVLDDQLEELKKELRTLMIDRNTAALRMIAMERAGLPYPSHSDDLPSLDLRVGKLIQDIQGIKKEISAWKNLLENIDRPDLAQQIKPMIRTIELQRDQDDRIL
jgi:hypothetical protein